MINYFRELLATLKSIQHSLQMLAECVQKNPRHYGVKFFISTGNWNDNG